MRRVLVSLATLLTLLLLAAVPSAQATRGSKYHPGVSTKLGVVSTESPAASRVGRAVLEEGGNAMDAAVATIFALGVARPQSCGIGGGGFLTYRSHTGAVRTLDFRETAPAAIRPDQYVNDPLAKQFTGHTTVGVPGTVAGMATALATYGSGKFSFADELEPAEQLASLGFKVPTSMSGSMKANAARLSLFPAAAAQFLKDGQPYAPGDTLVQKDLAATLRRLMRGGPKAFYEGTTARRVIADMNANRPTSDPGIMTLADLKAYKAKWREPVQGDYRGYEVDSAPPPTSGGVTILEMLRLLAGFDLKAMGASSAQSIHTIAEAQRIAWADRGQYWADPDVIPQPIDYLTSESYADSRRPEINPDKTQTHAATPTVNYPTEPTRAASGDENPLGSTTQTSIIDARGNAVSVTCTIEQEFGSAVVAPTTGFLLNNELTDFGAPGTANAPAPGKRPRSSMSPTILVKDRKPVLVTGGAGGATIVMGTLLSIIDRADYGMTIPEIADAERFDDQGTSTLMIEDGRLAPGVTDALTAKGWTLQRLGEYGVRPRNQVAGYDLATGRNVAASDSRSDQAALVQRR